MSIRRILVCSVLATLASFSSPGPTPAQEEQAPCVVLKRMGPADQVTSHLYSFGMRGKQFQFVEGQLPKGVKFHGRLTDHDIRKIQDAGGKITIVDSHYTAEELKQAKASCSSPVSTKSETTAKKN